MEGCAGWRYVAEELAAAGITAHLAEPAGAAYASWRPLIASPRRCKYTTWAAVAPDVVFTVLTYGSSLLYGPPSVRNSSSPASKLAGHRIAPSVTPESRPKFKLGDDGDDDQDQDDQDDEDEASTAGRVLLLVVWLLLGSLRRSLLFPARARAAVARAGAPAGAGAEFSEHRAMRPDRLIPVAAACHLNPP